MKKRVFILVALSLGIIIATYAFWVSFPPVKDPAFVEQAMKNASERFEAIQAQAKDPAKNGYLTPEFLPFWGRRGQEADDKAPINNVFDNWANFSSPSTGEPVDHKKLQIEEDEKYLAALKEFDAMAPSLLEALRKPIFTTPEDRLAFDNIVLNFIAYRKAAQTLVGLAEAKKAQNRPVEVADILVTVVQSGERLMGHNSLIHDMIGVAIQAIGGEGIALLVDPAQPIGAEKAAELTGRLVAAVPSADQLYRSLEAELLMGHNGITDIIESGSKAADEVPVSGIPGFMQREDRIYQNVMAGLMKKAQAGEATTLPPGFDDPSLSDWITGKTGILAQILVPNFTRAGAQVDFNRARTSGIATAFGVMTFREKEGRLPKDLDELAQSGIPVLSESDLKAMGYKVEGSGARLSVPFKPPEDMTFNVSHDGEGWFELQGEEIVFKL